jgi:glycerophosphoryl diester phosphodiesterase
MTRPCPEIIAHRGASRDCRENTLAAFALALAQGADGIELDVHGTADGELVVHHDHVLRPKGRSGLTFPIASLTTAAVRRVPLTGGHRVPTLAEVFALVAGRARLYVEIKAPGIDGAVADFLSAHPAAWSAVHAFDHRIPVAVRARRPGTRIGLLSASYPLDLAAVLRGTDASDFWQHAELVDEALVQQVHDAGMRVVAWTENDAPHARQLAAWGVDAICTDIPGALRTALSTC